MDQDDEDKKGDGDGSNTNQNNTTQSLSQTIANGGLPVLAGLPIANGFLAPLDND